MLPKIHALWDGDESRPEVSVSGTCDELSCLGVFLTKIETAVTLTLEPRVSKFYSMCLRRLTIEPSGGDGRIEVAVVADTLRIRGGAKALAALAQCLLNFFEGGAVAGSHFHLDYYEGSELLEPTQCALIFEAE